MIISNRRLYEDNAGHVWLTQGDANQELVYDLTGVEASYGKGLELLAHGPHDDAEHEPNISSEDIAKGSELIGETELGDGGQITVHVHIDRAGAEGRNILGIEAD